MLAYSDFYNSKELSDAEMVIQVLKDKEPGAASHVRPRRSSKRLRAQPPEDRVEAEVVAEYPAHRLVLMAHSQYFRTFLSKWCNSSGPPTVSLIVTEQQVSAAKVLFKFLYFDCLPDDFDQQDLVNLITLADKYQVDSCMNQCVDYFAKLPDSLLHWTTILQLLALPDSILATDKGLILMDCIKTKVFYQLGDLDATLRDDSSRKKLCDLPLPILEDLLRRDELTVSCENVVMVAIAVWLNAYKENQHTQLTQLSQLPQLSQLAQHSQELKGGEAACGSGGLQAGPTVVQAAVQLLQYVRVGQLTSSFVKAATIAYDWFSRSPCGTGALLLAEALGYHLACDTGRKRLEDRASQIDKHRRFCRRRPPPTKGLIQSKELMIEWMVSIQNILLREKEATETCHNIWICSPFYFFRGYMFALYLIIFPGPGKPSHGKLYLGLRWHLGDDVDGDRSKRLSSIPLQCEARVVLQHRPTPMMFTKKAQPGSAYDWRGFGWPRVFEDADLGSWEQYIVDGNLCFTATITDVE